MFAYVGSRTSRERQARGEGISVFRVGADQRRLELVQVVGELFNPSFLALNRRGNRLYTVHGDGHEVSVFQVDPHSGVLRFLQRQDCGGRNPVHLALDPTERRLLVSNHLTHTVAVLLLDTDGRIGAVAQQVEMVGTPGPHRIEQPFAKPHHNPFDPSGRFVAVPDKGLNRIFVYRFVDGRLEPAEVPAVDTRETAGPRHLAFHPWGPHAYVVNELDSTVTAYRFDARCGALTPIQVVSSLPGHFTADSRASEIVINTAGTTLYASNRGGDSVTAWRIDPADGTLQYLETVPTQGRTPRFIAITPNQATLFALNEDSDTLVALQIDPVSGRLAPTDEIVAVRSPVCMVFSPGTP